MLNNRTIQFGGASEVPDRLVHTDCVQLQQSLPDNSVDLIYLDPPFGTGSTRRSQDKDKSYRDLPNIPEAFIDWITPCLTHSRRLLNATGSLFLHLDYRSIHYAKVFLDRLFGRNRFINEIIWCYSVGGRSKRRFARKHDTILWYSKGAEYVFRPEDVLVSRKPSSHMRIVIDDDGQTCQQKTDRRTGKVYRYPVHRGKIPEDWWTDIDILNRSHRERSGWPTQKPTELLTRIIKSASHPGQRVADWYSGSGTTAIVAQRLGRTFIATDRERMAIECAEKRLCQQGHQMVRDGHLSPPPDLLIEYNKRITKLATTRQIS